VSIGVLTLLFAFYTPPSRGSRRYWLDRVTPSSV